MRHCSREGRKRRPGPLQEAQDGPHPEQAQLGHGERIRGCEKGHGRHVILSPRLSGEGSREATARPATVGEPLVEAVGLIEDTAWTEKVAVARIEGNEAGRGKLCGFIDGYMTESHYSLGMVTRFCSTLYLQWQYLIYTILLCTYRGNV